MATTVAFDWTTTLRGPDKMPGFIATREHRRLKEFATAVRRQRTIGLCFGPAGVGKTWSARRYAHWHRIEPFLLEWGPRDPSDTPIHALAARSRIVFYTPAVGAPLKQMKDDVNYLAVHMGFSISAGRALKDPSVDPMRITSMELLIIDEAERLDVTALEWLRDIYDRAPMGLILTGMPGIEKSLSRYAQLLECPPFRRTVRLWFERGDELAGRAHPKRGVRMDRVVVLNPSGGEPEHRGGVGQGGEAHVVASQRLHEGLAHAVALGRADGCEAGHEVERGRKVAGLGGGVGPVTAKLCDLAI